MRVDFSVSRLPATGRVKDACGLPFSCVLQPFAHSDKLSNSSGAPPALSVLGRCRSCFSYINCFCNSDERGFVCSMCGTHTSMSGRSSARYKLQPGVREALPELRSHMYEAICDDPRAESNNQEPGAAAAASLGAPAYVAVVDTACSEEFIELAKGSLMAALEALPPDALFGLVTFSDRIGLHDVRGPMPLTHCLPVLEQLPLLVPLEAVVPLGSLLVPVGRFREAIAHALDQLHVEASIQRSHSQAGSSSQQSTHPGGDSGRGPTPVAPEHMDRAGGKPCRAFGPALQAVIEYLRGTGPPGNSGDPSAEAGPPWLGHARLLVFLSGPPDLGPGKTTAAPEAQQQQQRGRGAAAATPQAQALDDPYAIDPRSRSFYQQAAVAAAALGVTVDMYVASPELVGLQVLEPLCHSTGGALYLYPSVEEAALPQDLYRRLSGPYAVEGLLRIRTSAEWKAVRCYGRCYSNPQHEALWHVPGCAPGDAFVVDFKHATGDAWSAEDALPPTLQVAYQYSVVVPIAAPGPPVLKPSGISSMQGGDMPSRQQTSRPCFVAQRRLRVSTFRFDVGNLPREVYSSAHADAILTTLVHKVVRASKERGVSAARSLVRDWLCTFVADYHKNAHMRAYLAQLIQTPVDVTFESCPALLLLPRLAYALLRTPLLLPAAQRHADLTAYLQHLWTTLPPSELSRAVYPALSSFTDPDHLAHSRHTLSQAALRHCEAPIYLLDAYILLLVYYRRGRPEALPYPPPQASLLRRTIAAIRQERRITPHVEILKEGAEGADIFNSLLIDDPDDEDADGPVTPDDGTHAAAGPAPTGLLHFCDQVRAEVVAQLQAEATGG